MYEIPQPNRDFKSNVRYTLKKLALEATDEGTQEKLADIIEVHPTTFSGWITDGDVPAFRARRIEKRFGADRVKAVDLSLELHEKAKLDNSGTDIADGDAADKK